MLSHSKIFERKSIKPFVSKKTLEISTSFAFSILLVIIIFAWLISLTEIQLSKAFAAIFQGSFGNKLMTGMTFVKATPLLLAGLAVALPYKAGLFNIGAEGQLYIGAVAASFVAIYFPSFGVFSILLATMAGFFAGAIWGAIPGYLKAKLGWHEIIVTLMMNYIGILLTNYLVEGPMGLPKAVFPQSRQIIKTAFLPYVSKASRLHIGFFLSIAIALALYIILKRTLFGFHLKITGSNPIMMKNLGLSSKKYMFLSMLIGGGLAGIAGAFEILGVHHRLIEGFSPGYGYQAIAVSFLGQNHPIGIIFAAGISGALNTGGNFMQRDLGVPGGLIYIVQALPVLFLATFEKSGFPMSLIVAIRKKYSLMWGRRNKIEST